MSYIRRLRGAFGVAVQREKKSCVCYPMHYVMKSGCLNARQRSLLLVDRVGMRLGLEAGYPVMGTGWGYRLWCMNYYEPVMSSQFVSHTSGAVVNTTPSAFKSRSMEPGGKRRTKLGIAYTTLLLVIMTGYKTNLTGTIITAIS